MATVVGSSTGAIDVKSTVDQLIEVEMVKRIDPLDTKLTARTASVGALTQLRALVTNLQDSIDTFADTKLFSAAQTDAVTGATLSATQADVVRLQNLAAAAKDFVTNYNAVQAAVTKYGTVDLSDSTRDTPAKVALYGDPVLQHFRQVMREGYFSGLHYQNTALAADGTPLSDRADKTMTISFVELGVTRKTDGTLAFSKTALQKSAAALTADESNPNLTKSSDSDPQPRYSDSKYLQPKLLERFAAGVTGSMTSVVGGKVVETGIKAELAKANRPIVGDLDLRSSQYNSQLYTLRNKRVTESAKIQTERTRLLKTYSSLNAMLANMSSTSNFLSAQLASLTKSNN
jgi:flagellar capping protein FliD